MVPLTLAVPSTLYAWMGVGRCCRRKFALDNRPILMKFLVVLQLMRAVVSMICVPVASLMGRQMVHLLGRATDIWKVWEEDVNVTS